MEELLEDNKFFKENEIKGPRMYWFTHELYNSEPDIIGYLESAFDQAYEIVMKRIIPAQKDAEICDLKNKIMEMEKEIKNLKDKCDKSNDRITEMRKEISNQDEIIARYEEE